MKKGNLLFLVGLVFIGNTQILIAKDFDDICNMPLEGASIAMSKESIQSTWENAGFVDSGYRKKQNKLSKHPEPIQSLLFQTKDRQPNENFVKMLGWKHTISSDSRRIYVNYVAPKDPTKLDDYEKLYRSKLTAYCEYRIDSLRKEAPAVIATRASRVNPNPKTPIHEFCENALKGDFRTDGKGHAIPPPHSLYITNAQGCRVSYSKLNLRGYSSAFSISIENKQ